MCQWVIMRSLEIALNLDSSITEEESNQLAKTIIESKSSIDVNLINDIALALCNIGSYRYSGNGYSIEVSDLISLWIENNFKQNEIYTDIMIELIYELTSKESDDMVRRLMSKNVNIQGVLLEAFSYKGT